MKWLIPFLMLNLAFACEFVTIRDNELFNVKATNITKIDEGFEIEPSESIIVSGVTKQKVTLLNYTLKVTPRNIEKLANDMGFPTSDEPNLELWEGSGEYTFEIPDLVCGNYKVSGEAYYDLNGTVKKYEDKIQIKVPCQSFKSRLIYGLASHLPYNFLKRVAGWFGFTFG